jgi:tetratricopeptide (TPR) repeat protein
MMTFAKSSRSKALLLAAAVASLGLAMPANAAVSKTVGLALQEAQAAVKARNASAAISAVKRAQAAASTAEEKQKSAQMAGYVYTATGRYSDAAAALQSIGAGPSQMAPLYYRAGQYDRAIAEARKGGGEQMQILIAQALLKKGDYKGAVTAYQSLIKANGPKGMYLENLAGAQYKSGDKAGYLATTERLVRSDSSPARWKALLTNFRQNPMRPEAKLAMFHLMSATGTLSRPEDYAEFAKLALIAGQAGVAEQALTKATLPDDAMTKSLVTATARMAASAPKDAVSMSSAPTTAFRGAGAYMGLGQYDKAIATYDKVIAAGGNSADQARVFKGIAALKGGKVAMGKTVLDEVTDKGGMQDIAHLWWLYASTKGAAPKTV